MSLDLPNLEPRTGAASDAQAALWRLREELGAAAKRACAQGAPRGVRDRLESAWRLVDRACLVVTPIGDAPGGVLDDTICKGVLVEGHRALGAYERWTRELERGLQSIDRQLDSLARSKAKP